MKNWILGSLNKMVLMVILLITNFSAMAQEEGGSVVTKTTRTTTHSSTQEWYTMPWVWTVGAGIFILLLAAILRSGDRRTDA